MFNILQFMKMQNNILKIIQLSSSAKINAVINSCKRLIVWHLKSSPSRLSTGRIGED